MNKLRNILLVIIAIAFNSTIFSQRNETILIPEVKKKFLPFGLSVEIPNYTPQIGLALSGGGARGLAQIGVLKSLIENNIPIDVIVGTSMGSIVGGLFASGYSIDELDSIAKWTKWNELLSVEIKSNRRDLFIDQKITEDKAIFSLRLKGLKPIFPTSINDGQKLINYLNLLMLQSPIHIKKNFDELETNFKAVCTNLETGTEVILKSGSLTQAMRASSSVSFLLSPVQIDSLQLVDGGLVANIPVKITNREGVDFTIAVNTTSSLRTKDELSMPWYIADQVVSIPMKILNKQQLDSANFIFEPEMNGISSDDFSNTDSLIKSGYEEAQKKIHILKRQIDSLEELKYSANEKIIQNFIVDDSNELGKLFSEKIKNREKISSKDILKFFTKIFNDGYYENLSANLLIDSIKTKIKINGERIPLLNEIIINGISLIDDKIIFELEKKLINLPINNIRIYSFIKSILNIYRKKGFSLAELDSININRITGSLYLNFREGLINNLIIKGNSTSSTTLITREFPLKEKELFSIEKVKNGLANLRNTNLFENIELRIERDKSINTIILFVTEKISNVARFGFKLDNESKILANLDIRDENLFGTGTELGLLIFLSGKGSHFILEQKANRIFNTYLTYNLSAYYKIKDLLIYADEKSANEQYFSRKTIGEYSQAFYGFSIAVGSQFEKFGNVIIKGKYEINEVKNIRDAIVNPYKNSIVSIRASSTIDTQDKYPYPNNGIKFIGFYETAQKFLGGGLSFSNIGFEYKGYLNFLKNNVIATSVSMGFADKTLPLSQQYSIGGQYSFFGMREDEYRGRQIFLSSFEYRLMLPVKFYFDSYFSVRYDLGSVWAEQEEIRFKDLKHGIGITLSLNTPIGPADFSLGNNFIFKKDLPGNPISWGPVYFYFSIGYYY